MSKYGEIIKADVPVLIHFYTEWHEKSINSITTVNKIASELGSSAKVCRIDVDKNQILADALSIKKLPTVLIYKGGKVAFRTDGELDKEELIQEIQKAAK